MILYIKHILISILIYGDGSTVFLGPHRLGDGSTGDESTGDGLTWGRIDRLPKH